MRQTYVIKYRYKLMMSSSSVMLCLLGMCICNLYAIHKIVPHLNSTKMEFQLMFYLKQSVLLYITIIIWC